MRTSTWTIARARRRDRCSTAISTSSNSDVRAGDNAQRHDRQWSGFVNWWSDVFGGVSSRDRPEVVDGCVRRPRRRGRPLAVPPNRPAERVHSGCCRRGAGVPDRLAGPTQLSGDDGVPRSRCLQCVADSVDAPPTQVACAVETGAPPVARGVRERVGTATELVRSHEPRAALVAQCAHRSARLFAGLHDAGGAERARRPVRVRGDARPEVRFRRPRPSTARTTGGCCRSSRGSALAGPSCSSGDAWTASGGSCLIGQLINSPSRTLPGAWKSLRPDA